MSGGRSTVAMKRGAELGAQAGDVSAVHALGHALINQFFIELKNYKDLNYPGLLKDTGNLYKFWQTAKLEALKYRKMPMLIGKQNQSPIIVVLNYKGLLHLNLEVFHCALAAPSQDLYALFFDGFLKINPGHLGKRIPRPKLIRRD